MSLPIDQWHQRYKQQARWTKNVRNYLYQKCDLQYASRVLDVGCGTGVLESEFATHTTASIFGIDIDFKTLHYAKKNSPTSFYTTSNCLSLPFHSALFDITLCHFLLLWVKRVPEALAEMKRVTHPGGYVLAMAEPDYGGRIDFPDELMQLGNWQTQALKKQGADTSIGRQLRAIFSRAGLTGIEVGVLGGQWLADNLEEFELEWRVLASDLMDDHSFQRQAEWLKGLEIASRKAQQRILYVPVFYAFGVVPV